MTPTPRDLPQATLLGLPFDGQSSFLKGAAEAPPLIRRAFTSPSTNTWTEGGENLENHPRLRDAGDLAFDDESDFVNLIHGAVGELVHEGERVLSLGGDHSVTYPILKAFHSFYPTLTLVHVDAHADLYDEFEANPLSHACPFARIMEEGLVDRLIQVGIRTLNDHQREQAQRFGVEIWEMKDGLPDLSAVKRPFYLSLDLDGLDPAFAPGVSHPEPGGLSTREVISLIQSLRGPLVGADVVEYNPRQDLGDRTARVAAKLMKELVSVMLRS